MNWEKCFPMRKMKFWTHHQFERLSVKVFTIWCITQAGNMSNENTSTASLYYIQNSDEEEEAKFT